MQQDRVFDRRYELDLRSLNYTIGSKLLAENQPVYRPRSYTWSVDKWLDQGREGSCVGHAYAHDLVARPQVVHGVDSAFARNRIYFEAQKIDEWDGGAYPGASPFYEGTSVLAGAKVCKALGYYSSYHWALDIEELVQGIGYFGPCVIGMNWYEAMSRPDSDGFIRPMGNITGGHALLVHAVKIKYKGCLASGWFRKRTWSDVDRQKSYVTLWNSWGSGWGQAGTAKLSLVDLDKLLRQRGDACFPSRTSLRIAV